MSRLRAELAILILCIVLAIIMTLWTWPFPGKTADPSTPAETAAVTPIAPSTTSVPSLTAAPSAGFIGTLSQSDLNQMEAGSILVPEVGLYAPLEPLGLIASTYRGESVMQMDLPSDPSRAMFYNKGGAPCGTQGTILVAGHIRNHGVDGVLKKIVDVRPSPDRTTLAVVKCASGQIEMWRLRQTVVLDKFDWPSSVMTDQGPYQLVVSTCTGKVVNGHYMDNVLQYFEPVNPALVQIRP